MFWRWLNPRELAYVTGKAVYHWSMEGNAKPVKKFDIPSDNRQVNIFFFIYIFFFFII